MDLILIEDNVLSLSLSLSSTPQSNSFMTPAREGVSTFEMEVAAIRYELLYSPQRSKSQIRLV